MIRPVPPDVLVRAAELLAAAPPGHVLDALARHPEREAARVAIVAHDINGGSRRAIDELRQVAGTAGAEGAARR